MSELRGDLSDLEVGATSRHPERPVSLLPRKHRPLVMISLQTDVLSESQGWARASKKDVVNPDGGGHGGKMGLTSLTATFPRCVKTLRTCIRANPFVRFP